MIPTSSSKSFVISIIYLNPLRINIMEALLVPLTIQSDIVSNNFYFISSFSIIIPNSLTFKFVGSTKLNIFA